MGKSDEKPKDRITDFMEKLSKKIEDSPEKSGRREVYLTRMDKTSAEFKAIARASVQLEEFPLYLNSLAIEAQRRWNEIKKANADAWNEWAINNGYSTMGDYRINRKTGEVYEVSENEKH